MKLPTANEIRFAHERLRKAGISSDLIGDSEPGIYLKCENRLLGNSYKIRGVLEFFANSDFFDGSIKVLSAGNLALAAAIESSARGVQCTAVVPQGISDVKNRPCSTMVLILRNFRMRRFGS